MGFLHSQKFMYAGDGGHVRQPRAPTSSRTSSESSSISPLSALSPVQSSRSSRESIDGLDQDCVFSATGLLGNEYQILKQQADVRQYKLKKQQLAESPFTGGLLQDRMQEVTRQPYRENRNSMISNRCSMVSQSNTILSRSNTISRQSIASTAQQPPATSLQQRSLSRSRTTTERSMPTDSVSYSRATERPQPLLEMVTALPERSAPWRRHRGHGVRAPAGTPLISLATNSIVQWQPAVATGPPSSSSTSPSNSNDAFNKSQRDGLSRRSTNREDTGANRSHSIAASTFPERRSKSQHTARASARWDGVNLQRQSMRPQQYQHDGDDDDVPLINFVCRAEIGVPPKRPQGFGNRRGTLKYV
ncbi:hypothetical protein S7711_02488 [Stachybotrys chartarum IBT 7711]|uniref:Uncharacterized protein n=1 Tax=Stachybotrys chartarum (strain CBS 109288 / IBT 7711) TaxID=1280523 RepID=A0A084B570_STACB|nr:hypothetical protein S7711_02488 [Stachybotrys chartarum IBT 7711]